MKKGIVIEIDKAYLTLLTPEGEFLQARRQIQPYAIGEEIQFFPIGNVKTSSKSLSSLKNIFRVKSVWAIMAALFIFLGSFIPMYFNNKAYAYMSIDVNPSIELGVNKKMQVVELTGFNKEGKEIITRLDDWKKKDVSELTQAILAEMKKEGFLKTKGHVIISTVRTKEAEVKAEKMLQKNIEAIKANVNNQQLEVTVLTGTEKELEKAHELGITTGKYQDNKLQSSLKEKNKQNVNSVEKKQEKNTVPSQPAKTIPPGQLKKQTEGQTFQNKGNPENRVQSETNRWGGNSMPPGQFKKFEEEQFNHNNEQQKNQSYRKEKSNENKKSNSNEKYNEKHNEKSDGRYNEKSEEKHNRRSEEKHNRKNDEKYKNK